jgi:hypothetical protein
VEGWEERCRGWAGIMAHQEGNWSSEHDVGDDTVGSPRTRATPLTGQGSFDPTVYNKLFVRSDGQKMW